MNFCTGEELKISQSHAIKPQTLQIISHSPALLINESNYPTIELSPSLCLELIIIESPQAN